MTHSSTPSFDTTIVDPDWKIVIIRSIWYPELTSALVSSAKKRLVELGLSPENIAVIDAPGSFEIPLLAEAAFSKADGIIAFGIIVQGGTHHARVISDESASGCMKVQLEARKPLVYEVLYVDSLDDARVRSVGEYSKGPIAAETLMTQLARLAELS